MILCIKLTIKMLQRQSSFSSFGQESSPYFPINNHMDRIDSGYFSAFEDQNYCPNIVINNPKSQISPSLFNKPINQPHPHIINTQSKVNYSQKIQQLYLIIQRLQSQNETLKQKNSNLHQSLGNFKQQIQELKKAKQKFECSQKQIIKERLIKEQRQGYNKKERIQNLLKQVIKAKENIGKLKQEVDYYKQKANNLQNIIKQHERSQIQQLQCSETTDWESQFIGIFIDMSFKLCPQLNQQWSTKKKVQIGWKIIKNIIQKALAVGVVPPKIQKQIN